MKPVAAVAPKKLFYRIQEVSRITGVKPHVLRYWETEFASLRPQKGPNDQRRYRASDIDLVVEIKKLLYDEKFTIAGARRKIESAAHSRGDAGRQPEVRRQRATTRQPQLQCIARQLGRVREELVELQTLLAS